MKAVAERSTTCTYPECRRGFVRSLGAGCAALAALLLMCAGEARAQIADVDHWSATLTRANFVGGSGYNHHGMNMYGTLTSSTFTYVGVTYTVSVLAVATDPQVTLVTTPSILPDDTGLKLRIPTFRGTASGNCPVGERWTLR